MAKRAKAFRLSEQAVAHLAALVEWTGSSETAVVEMALAYYDRHVSRGPAPTIGVGGSGGHGQHRHKAKVRAVK